MLSDGPHDLLARAGDVPGLSATTLAAMVDDVVAVSSERRTARRGRTAPVFAIALGGAIVLTGGASVTAAVMSIPPFQSLEPGMYRVPDPIHAVIPMPDGTHERCLAFVEFKGLNAAEEAHAREVVDEYDWAPTVRAAADDATAANPPQAEFEAAFSDALGVRLTAIIIERTGLPEASTSTRPGPAFSGWSMSCEPLP
jgi:hypothetical protein